MARDQQAKRQRSITRTLPNPIAPQPNIMAKAITRKAKSIQQTPSNIPRMLANTANKRIPRVSNKNEREARFASGLYFLSRATCAIPVPFVGCLIFPTHSLKLRKGPKKGIELLPSPSVTRRGPRAMLGGPAGTCSPRSKFYLKYRCAD